MALRGTLRILIQMRRGGFIPRAAVIALCASAVLLLASCSEETRDQIRSNVSDAISSVSVSGPEPTEEPAPTEEPTEEPAPTEEPTEIPSEEPSVQPAAEEASEISPWIWVLLAIAASAKTVRDRTVNGDVSASLDGLR